MNERQEIQCLKKAFRVLVFMNQCSESTAVDVAKAIGVPRPTSYRILETLASDGYLEKRADCGVYRITRKVQRLAVGFRKRDLLLEVAKPMIYAMGQELGWPLAIYTPREADMIVRINTDYECALALDRFRIGYEVSMPEAAIGYCYLAYCAEAERRHLLTQLSENWQAEGIFEADEKRHLIATSRQGYWDQFNSKRLDEVLHVIGVVRKQGFCNLEFKDRREGSLGVPLLMENEPIGGIEMRYIKSTMKGTGRIQSHYEPQLQRLSKDITSAYLARLKKTRAAH